MAAEYDVLSLAAEKRLPDPIDASNPEIDVDLVRELIDAKLLTGIDLGTLDGPAYGDVKISHSGRRRLEELRGSRERERERLISESAVSSRIKPHRVPTTPMSAMKTPRIFISHSSVDKELSVALITLLRAALNIPSDDIRCTSVEGYRLQAGVEFLPKLRAEILNCEAFIAILSKDSTKSSFVLLEIGARWGTTKHSSLLLGAGTSIAELDPTFSSHFHLASTENEDDLHDLIDAVASELRVTKDKTSSYRRALRELMSVSPAQAQPEAKKQQPIFSGQTARSDVLSENSLLILWHMAAAYANGVTNLMLTDLLMWTKLDRLRLDRALNALKGVFVGQTIYASGSTYKLTDEGLQIGDALFSRDESDPSRAIQLWRAENVF